MNQLLWLSNISSCSNLERVNLIAYLHPRFPEQWEATSSHRIRDSKDMQYSFSYFYYLMGVTESVPVEKVFDDMDTDLSGYVRVFEDTDTDISGYVRVFDNMDTDLSGYVTVFDDTDTDLSGYVRVFDDTDTDLSGYVRVFEDTDTDLSGYVRVFDDMDTDLSVC